MGNRESSLNPMWTTQQATFRVGLSIVSLNLSTLQASHWRRLASSLHSLVSRQLIGPCPQQTGCVIDKQSREGLARARNETWRWFSLSLNCSTLTCRLVIFRQRTPPSAVAKRNSMQKPEASAAPYEPEGILLI